MDIKDFYTLVDTWKIESIDFVETTLATKFTFVDQRVRYLTNTLATQALTRQHAARFRLRPVRRISSSHTRPQAAKAALPKA